MLGKIISIAVAVIAGVAMTLSLAGCGLPDNAAASVNGVIITKDDVQNRINVVKALYPQEVPVDENSQEFIDYRGKVTKQLVSEEMERQEAEKRGVSVSPDEIEEALTVYVEDQYLGDIEKMQQEYADAGISIDDLRGDIERDLLHKKMLDSFREETTVSEEELQLYYDQNKSKYVHSENRQVRLITAPTQSDAAQALARIDAGEDFANVAAEVTTNQELAAKGGLFGLVTREELPANIAEIAFSLPMSGVSQPVQTSDGWTIVKVDFIAPGSEQTLDDLRDQLTLYLTNQKFSQAWKDYSNGLWESYDIEYAEGYEPPSEEVDSSTEPLDPNAPVS